MKRKLLTSLFCLAVFGACELTLAFTFTVNNLDDSGGGSLRQAILDAKGIEEDNIINIAVEGTINLSSPLPLLGAEFGSPPLNLVIKGRGASVLTINGGDPESPIFRINDTATIKGITISKGGNGAIHNFGKLVLRDCVITGNTGRTGAGAIFNTGTLEVINCTISKNTVRGDSNFQDGAAFGGAISNGGTAEIRNSTLTGNAAFGARPPQGSTGSHASGGAIKNFSEGTVTLINSTVSGNMARGGDLGVFLTARGSGEATAEDAANYYRIVDPGNLRTTLGKWWQTNRFDPQSGRPPYLVDSDGILRGSHAAYLNNNDLGFGRDTTMFDQAGLGGSLVASWLSNYSLTPPYPDQNPRSADAASRREPGRGIATVCMESTPIEGEPTGRKVVKFFVFNGTGPDARRVLCADLDGYGEKFVPQLCTTCHGGRLPLVAQGAVPTRQDVLNMNAHFREFDIASIKFPRPGKPVDDPSRSIPTPDEQERFHQLNQLVLKTRPADAIKELITGWYANTGDYQNADFVPFFWEFSIGIGGIKQNPPQIVNLYRQVVATSCRTCHVALEPSFSTFPEFKASGPAILNDVLRGQPKTMPHAMTTFKNFWKTDRPTVLANTLAVTVGVPLPDVTTGADGGSGRGGGIDNEGRKLTIVASTVAFNTASGGVGYNFVGNAEPPTLSASIGMADGGGVFSDSFSSSLLRSSIIACNFADTTEFADTIALRLDSVGGPFVSQDYNLIGQSAEFTLTGETSHNLLNVNPKLGLLRYNGGPTFTHALLEGSPAIDAGDDQVLALVTKDQRGFERKVGNSVDIGAFEFPGTEMDVTSQVGVIRGGFYFNNVSKRYLQQVTLQNITATAIETPVILVLERLSDGAVLFNSDGLSAGTSSPFINVSTGTDNIFSAGESVSLVLEFADPTNAAITYSAKVLTLIP
jgi:hypothetical protein